MLHDALTLKVLGLLDGDYIFWADDFRNLFARALVF